MSDDTPDLPHDEPTVLEVVPRERPLLSFRLGDDDDLVLHARKPKDVRVMAWADITTARESYQILRDIFRESPESYDHVLARLEDDDDYLEWEHLTPLLDLLEVNSTGRPTVRPNASGRSSGARQSGQRSKAKRR